MSTTCSFEFITAAPKEGAVLFDIEDLVGNGDST